MEGKGEGIWTVQGEEGGGKARAGSQQGRGVKLAWDEGVEEGKGRKMRR